jgi:hypothetical protein
MPIQYFTIPSGVQAISPLKYRKQLDPNLGGYGTMNI